MSHIWSNDHTLWKQKFAKDPFFVFRSTWISLYLVVSIEGRLSLLSTICDRRNLHHWIENKNLYVVNHIHSNDLFGKIKFRRFSAFFSWCMCVYMHVHINIHEAMNVKKRLFLCWSVSYWWYQDYLVERSILHSFIHICSTDRASCTQNFGKKSSTYVTKRQLFFAVYFGQWIEICESLFTR